MLDGMPLSTKLTVAREWFRRSRAGEYALVDGTADRFAELLEQCQSEAERLEKRLGLLRTPLTITLQAEPVPAALAAVRAEMMRVAAEQIAHAHRDGL